MKISCPHCGQHYELEDSFAGQPVTCERCWKDFTVPAEKPSAAVPPPEPKPEPAAEAPAPTTPKPVPAAPVPETAQRCPYCAGAVPAGVKKCRHCGEWIDKNRKIRIIALAAAMVVLLGVAAAGVWLVAVRVLTRPTTPETSVKPRPAPVASVPKKKTIIHPTIGVKHFVTPAHSATCVLYKNDREIMRKETTIGMVMFMRVECSPDDFFRVEMQYKNGYGTVAKITDSFERRADKSVGNVIELEPKWEHDREYPNFEQMKTSNLPPEEALLKNGLDALNRLEVLERVREKRALNAKEKQEARKLFAYLIDVYTVKRKDEKMRQSFQTLRRKWGLE